MSRSSDDRNDPTGLDRRELLKLGALGVGGAALGGLSGCAPAGDATTQDAGAAPSPAPPSGMAAAAPAEPFRTPPMERVRVGFVGVGLQGGAHVRNFLRIDGVDIVALCDVDVPRMEEVASWVEADGRPRPTLYGDGEEDFVRLCETEELDLVFTATPWRWHVPVCVAAMTSAS